MTDKETEEKKARTSKLAIATVISGLAASSLVFWTYAFPSVGDKLTICLASTVWSLVVVALGISSFIHIRKHPSQLAGKGLALSGIGIAAITFVFGSLGVLQGVSELASRITCGSQLAGCGAGLATYAQQEGKYPSSDKWCDSLIDEDYVVEKTLVCHAAYNAGDKGPCHYAINPNCEPNSPGDMVLLFETKAGWNQQGGPEMLTTENHKDKGSNILFNDGTMKFIRTKELETLKWKPYEPNQPQLKE